MALRHSKKSHRIIAIYLEARLHAIGKNASTDMESASPIVNQNEVATHAKEYSSRPSDHFALGKCAQKSTYEKPSAMFRHLSLLHPPSKANYPLSQEDQRLPFHFQT